MTKIDRRILRSRESIKNAVIELMSEKKFDDITIRDISDRANVNRGTIYLHYADKYDLLDKIIEEHIGNLRELCHSASDMTFQEGNYVWFDYFAANHLFFSTMLNTKSAAYFRSRFLDLVVQEYRVEVDVNEGKNRGLSEDIILQFFGAAVVGAVEWWFKHDMPIPARTIAEQTGLLLDRNL
ncbi:TetR/AcrR family transcriptional regulator [Saccharibacillus sp. CPCC 101409]|uniref:TetR/AcrR family transcriptional regulator n=1 Tax=Saccharibacillus sp. CPCC 101409 TaxID=3058041 RepID=UPI002673D9BB|nr:TetR/AcrR family transcriptional regulator [Saccharibacillus sp. CPCC 101409]MDO3411615.1 TetR/AcrR family transcriptional regulator [Saccharibacillus sp. CPCC 101409]